MDEEPVLGHFYATPIEVATFKAARGVKLSKNFIQKSAPLQSELDQILNHRKKPNLKEYAKKLMEISDAIDEAKLGEGEWTNDKRDELKAKLTKLLVSFNPKHREVREEGEQSNGDELSLENCVRCLGHVYKENPVSITSKGNGYESIYILGNERETSYGMIWKNGDESKVEKIIVIGATKAEIFTNEFDGRKIEIRKFRYDDRFQVIALDLPKDADRRGIDRILQKRMVDIERELWNNPEESKRMPFLALTGSKKKQENLVKKLPGASSLMIEREESMGDKYSEGAPGVFYQGSVISRGQDVDQFNLLFVNDCNFAQPFWNVANKEIADKIIADETINSVLRISPTLGRDTRTLKIIVMSERDAHKIEKCLPDPVVMTDEASRIAAIIKKLGVCGISERITDGKKTHREITKIGIDFELGKAKFMEMKSSTDAIVEDDMVKATKEKIMQFMRSQYNKRNRSVTTTAIRKAISGSCKYEMLKAALRELYHEKTLEMTKSGQANKWSIPQRKAS